MGLGRVGILKLRSLQSPSQPGEPAVHRSEKGLLGVTNRQKGLADIGHQSHVSSGASGPTVGCWAFPALPRTLSRYQLCCRCCRAHRAALRAEREMHPPAPCALEQDKRPWRTLKRGLWLGGP